MIAAHLIKDCLATLVLPICAVAIVLGLRHVWLCHRAKKLKKLRLKNIYIERL